jgi:hypothetical protein
MSQGLTSLPGFFKGSNTPRNNVYVRKGDDVTLDELTANTINTQDLTIFTLGGPQASMYIDNDEVLQIQNTSSDVTLNGIELTPSASSNGSLLITSNSTSVSLGAATPGTQALYCKSTPTRTVRNVNGTSAGVGVDNTFLGNTQVCTLIGSSPSLSFSFGTGGNPLPPGGVYDFIVTGASVTGATVSFIVGGSPVYTVTATNGTDKWVRMFCDGATVYHLVPT